MDKEFIENPVETYKKLKQEYEQYKKSKQASYEELQKKCNELELEKRKLKERLDQWISKCEQETKLKEFYQNELDQLKAENDTYKKMLEDEEVILALTEVRTGERHLWYSNAQKLEQTLREIKEIVYELTNEEYTDFIEEKQKQILNKISEVIENE